MTHMHQVMCVRGCGIVSDDGGLCAKGVLHEWMGHSRHTAAPLTYCGRSLQYNSIGDDGARALGEALKTNTALTKLL